MPVAGLLLRVIISRPPELGEVAAEIQFEVAASSVTDTTELGAARLRIGPGQHWEDHFIARLKLGSCRHPESIDLGLCRGQRLAAE